MRKEEYIGGYRGKKRKRKKLTINSIFFKLMGIRKEGRKKGREKPVPAFLNWVIEMAKLLCPTEIGND